MPGRSTGSDRDRMLAEVKRIWIDGYLKHSLDNLVRIELGLEETPDAVSGPFDLIVQQPDRAPRPLPPGQSVGATFDELGQALLILGALRGRARRRCSWSWLAICWIGRHRTQLSSFLWSSICRPGRCDGAR